MEDSRGWYEAEALMEDLTCHRHTMRATREEEIETRMRHLYPKALTILVSPETLKSPAPPAPEVMTLWKRVQRLWTLSTTEEVFGADGTSKRVTRVRRPIRM
jgi:hypothetical protein